MDFSQLTNEQLLEIINNPANDWQGTYNGDSTERYQGRQCFVKAAALILIGRELEGGNVELSRKQAEMVFYDVMRDLMHPRSVEGESGNSRFCVETMINLWKTKFSLIDRK